METIIASRCMGGLLLAITGLGLLKMENEKMLVRSTIPAPFRLDVFKQ